MKNEKFNEPSQRTRENIEYLTRLDACGATDLAAFRSLIGDISAPRPLRMEAIFLCGNLKDVGVCRVLLQRLCDVQEDAELRLCAAVTLGSLGRKRYGPKLLQLLQESDEETTRCLAARALWWLYASGTRSLYLLPILLERLKDPNEKDSVKAEVAVALANISRFGNEGWVGLALAALLETLEQNIRNGSALLKYDLIYAITQLAFYAPNTPTAKVRSLFELMVKDETPVDNDSIGAAAREALSRLE